jgi:outer membrane autotransporter protein
MSLGARLRVATQLFGDNGFYVRPMVDVNLGRTHAEGFSETGAGPLDLIVAGQWFTQANIIPSIEVGGEFSIFKETKVRPFASYGITRVLTGSNFTSSASLEGAPAGSPAFTVSRELDDTLQNVTLGFDVLDAQGFDLRVYYSGVLGDTSEQNSVSLKLGLPL